MDTTLIQQENVVEETQHQLMTLVDEQVSAIATVISSSGNESSATAGENKIHGLTDFLEREIKITQGTILSSQPRGTVLFRISLPLDLLQHEMYVMKIDGFRYIKATAEFKIVMNAQPFQAGIFRVMYFPVLSPDGSYNTSLSTMKQMTGLNGVDVNLESKEPMVISIPFIYPLPSWDMILEPDSYATVQFVVYSPLSSGSVSYTVFGRFRDVSLTMPTSQTLPSTNRFIARKFKQQGGFEEKLKSRQLCNKVLNFLIFFGSFLSLFSTVFQKWMNSRRLVFKQQIGAEERRAVPGGPVSSIANAVTNVATTLSGIPFLSSIAAPVATISNIVGSVASMFGWSKPRSMAVVTQTRPKIVECFNNYDGYETSHSMAMSVETATNVVDGKFGTTYDELHFNSLWRVPQFINSFTLRTSNTVDQRLFFMNLNPVTLTSERIGNTVITTNLGYICSMFELYRGSLVFNFKCAKTIFHSTRVAIVYFNSETEPPATYTPDLVKNYQIIWDIRETYEQSFSIPYIQGIEWLNLHSTDTNFKTSMGYIGVYVINELVVGGTASPFIEFLVEVFAGEDFSVAIPKNYELLNGYVQPITASDSLVESGLLVRAYNNDVRFRAPWEGGEGTSMAAGVVYDITQNMPLGTTFLYQGTNSSVSTATVTYNHLPPFPSITVQFTLLVNGTIETQLTGSYGNSYEMPGVFMFPVQQVVIVNSPAVKGTSISVEEASLDENKISDHSDPLIINRVLTVSDISLKYKNGKPILAIGDSQRLLKVFSRKEFREPVTYYFRGGARFTHENTTLALSFVKVVFLLEHGVYTLKIFDNWDKHKKKLLFYQNYKFKENKFFKFVEQQIGKEEALMSPTFSKITGSVDLVPFEHQHTIGENIISFRQMCKRYTLFSEKRFSSATNPVSGSFVMLDPHSFAGNGLDIIDYPSYIAPLYRFFNGEMRYKFIVKDLNGHLYSGPVDVFFLPNYTGNQMPSINSLNSSKVIHFPHIEGMGEFTIPYYNRNNKTILGDVRTNGLLAPVPSRFCVFVPGSQDLDLVVYRSIGENFSFGATLSAPTLVWTEKN